MKLRELKKESILCKIKMIIVSILKTVFRMLTIMVELGYCREIG